MSTLDFDAKALIEDPELKTPGGFIIRRYVIVTDDDGIASRTFLDSFAEGVVVPTGALGMVRTAELERQSGEITIYTVTPISTGDASIGQPADDIIWHNLLFQVSSQDDYSDFNFNVAVAQLAEPGGRPFVP